ncbi:hypothetical protein [Psychroserpens sp. MEBiC05023]
MSTNFDTPNYQRFFYNKKKRLYGRSLLEVYDQNPLSMEGLRWFLELGYIPGNMTLFEDIEVITDFHTRALVNNKELKLTKSYNFEDVIDTKIHEGKSKEQLISEGGKLFNQVIDKLYESQTKSVVLPITSGLDSRIILGGLLECTEAKNITALTWGFPKSYDFETGIRISKKLGIKHHALNIDDYQITEPRLKAFAESSDFSVPLFDHWPKDWVKQIVDEVDGSLWMGLLGGTLSGSNLPHSFVDDALTNFLKTNKRINSVISLSTAMLGEKPNRSDLEQIVRGFESVNTDALDIYLHHHHLIAPTKIHRDLSYVLPFTSPQLMRFFLSLPQKYRANRGLLRDIIINQYPYLSRFPSNRNGGLGLEVKGKKRALIKRYRQVFGDWDTPNKRRKYLSLNKLMNQDNNVANLVNEKLERLKSRRILNNDRMTILNQEFLGLGQRKIDHSRAIDALVSLEIILEMVESKR